mgnify:CR=1 FL=1
MFSSYSFPHSLSLSLFSLPPPSSLSLSLPPPLPPTLSLSRLAGALFVPQAGVHVGYEGVYNYGLGGVSWMVGASIIFCSLVTPKSLWFPLWFFDPLRSLVR